MGNEVQPWTWSALPWADTTALGLSKVNFSAHVQSLFMRSARYPLKSKYEFPLKFTLPKPKAAVRADWDWDGQDTLYVRMRANWRNKNKQWKASGRKILRNSASGDIFRHTPETECTDALWRRNPQAIRGRNGKKKKKFEFAGRQIFTFCCIIASDHLVFSHNASENSCIDTWLLPNKLIEFCTEFRALKWPSSHTFTSCSPLSLSKLNFLADDRILIIIFSWTSATEVGLHWDLVSLLFVFSSSDCVFYYPFGQRRCYG